MKTGLAFPSYMPDASSVTSNGVSTAASYPAANMASLKSPTKVARAAAAGSFQARVNLIGPRPVQFMAAVNHNLIDGTIRFQGWAGASVAGAPDYDSGILPVWPSAGPVETYPAIRPLVLDAPVSLQTVIITLTPSSATVVEVGAVEVAAWWEWIGISSRDAGVNPRQEDINLVGGAVSTADAWSPRVLNGRLDFMKVGPRTEQVHDFQIASDLNVPFVFCLDADDPASWTRTSYVARNQELPPLVGALYRHDAFNFRFVEHWR
ncbi:hypothetical protein CPT_Sansa40 [Caulobacter phage Sansa]|uniref:Uncharacterized protein n=1 Tax=Caulobacter phage Sansa TaxID=1675600 RepID=A0A0K1LLW8_9CAUD|nr:hypothetical protein HOR07_gp040 [Caulobacter phage Sansa]AKU43444.1 hypothetical protein CPT_Sansa40 [Caulobacter phage Sansa]